MKTYSLTELETIIRGLLAKGHEGDYWDYKQEWPSSDKNTDLLKDIVCFANTVHDRDCFIIFGANNRGAIVPLEESTRRTQNHILDWLYQQPFAEDNIPEVSVAEIHIDGKLLDVLIIYNSSRTPYYFREDIAGRLRNPPEATQNDKTRTREQNEAKTLRRGVIYTRNGDRNTAFDKIAKPNDIESLWKKRFHLTKPILEQFYEAMKKPEDWTEGDDSSYYNVSRPEFTLSYDDERDSSFREFYTAIYINPQAYAHEILCRYFGNVIKIFHVVGVDGWNYVTPCPEVESEEYLIGDRYFYMLADSPSWYLQQLLYEKMEQMGKSQQDRFYRHIPLFENRDEKYRFDCWATEHLEFIRTEWIAFEKETPCRFDGQFRSDCLNSKFVIHLLKICRDSNWQVPN